MKKKKEKILIMNLNILDVVEYWFDRKNVNKWFNASKADDDEITQKFLPYLELKNYDYALATLKEKLGYIILYDQMVRHFYRSKNENSEEGKIVIIRQYHEKALFLSMQIFLLDLDKETASKKAEYLNPEEKCFVLLPLRHTFNIHYLEIVIIKIKEYMKLEDHPMYRRFWRATLISYSDIKTPLIDIESVHENILDSEIFTILDKDHKSAHNLSNILPLNRKNKFYRAFESLFKDFSKQNLDISQSEIFKIHFEKEEKKLIISLSGGVDSMVASFVMSHCCKEMGIELIGVHINYGNRESCNLEVELVKRWSKLLNIKLYIRHIEHLKRPGGTQQTEEKEYSGLCSEDRTLYEEVTRVIRFQMYKRFDCPVILGHNLDDCEENMITNIRKSKCYDNLLGMKKVGFENGITLLRPMLDIPKSEIYDFAYEYEIPHLYDSTPKWSDRGRMRNELIPFLNKFDPGFIPGLFNLTESLTNMYKIYSNTVLNEFRKNKICFLPFGNNVILVNSKSPELDYGYQFWKDIIYGIIHEFSIKNKELIPSNKSIRFFSNKLSNRHYGKISLNNHLIFDFTKDEIIFSFI